MKVNTHYLLMCSAENFICCTISIHTIVVAGGGNITTNGVSTLKGERLACVLRCYNNSNNSILLTWKKCIF